MTVKNTHPDYNKMLQKWQRCRDVADGQDAVRMRTIAESVKHALAQMSQNAYIPSLKEQEANDYIAYVIRAPFYNATWRTIEGLNGMLFRKPPIVDAPDEVLVLLKDVTMNGDPVHMFMEDVGEEAMKVGRIGVLVDYPTVAEGTSAADAAKLNMRPRMCSYNAEAITNWDYRTINNAYILSQVVLTEQVSVVKDEFTKGSKTQYRVLDLGGVDPSSGATDLYRQRIYEINDKDEDVLVSGPLLPKMNGVYLDYIPFQFFGTDDLTAEIDSPPLIDLVDMNLSHWRTAADYEHGCHFSGLPTFYISGYRKGDGEKIYVGSSQALIFPDPQAKAAYAEVTSDFTALANSLKEKEARMAILGARMLEARIRGVESAEAAAIHRSGEQSMLSSVAQVLSIGMTRVVQWFSDWAGGVGEVSVDLNRDFYPMPMDPASLLALFQVWQGGGISKNVFFDNMQRGEVIDADATFEDEEAKINNEMKLAAQQNTQLSLEFGGGAPNKDQQQMNPPNNNNAQSQQKGAGA